MILSGGSDGLVAVSSPTTGMTVRVISDHQGAPINSIDVTVPEVSRYSDREATFPTFLEKWNFYQESYKSFVESSFCNDTLLFNIPIT